MIQSLFQLISEVIQSLLPEKSSTNKVWITRVIILILAGYGAAVLTFFALHDTALGERLGLTNLTPKLSELSQVSIITYRQSVWQRLIAARNGNDSIKGAFAIGLYNQDTGNFIRSKEEYSKAQAIIYASSYNFSKYDAIEVLEEGINSVIQQQLEAMVKTNGCVSGKLPDALLGYFRRGIQNFDSTHASACPVYAGTDRRITSLIAFFYTPKDATDNLAIDFNLRQITYSLRDYMNFNKPYLIYFQNVG